MLDWVDGEVGVLTGDAVDMVVLDFLKSNGLMEEL